MCLPSVLWLCQRYSDCEAQTYPGPSSGSRGKSSCSECSVFLLSNSCMVNIAEWRWKKARLGASLVGHVIVPCRMGTCILSHWMAYVVYFIHIYFKFCTCSSLFFHTLTIMGNKWWAVWAMPTAGCRAQCVCLCLCAVLVVCCFYEGISLILSYAYCQNMILIWRYFWLITILLPILTFYLMFLVTFSFITLMFLAHCYPVTKMKASTA